MRTIKIFATLIGFIALNGCKEDKNKVTVMGISAPEVKPKVQSATPTTLSTAALTITEESSPTDPASSLKSRIFSSQGPTAIFSILDKIDAGMNSIEKRLQGNEKGPDEDPDAITSYAPCLGDISGADFVPKTPATFKITFDFDNDGTADLDPNFTTYLHCYDDLTQPDGSVPTASNHNPDSKYWRAFGHNGIGDDEKWYIVEGSGTLSGEAGSAGASAIEVSKSQDFVNMWFRVGQAETAESQSVVLAHLVRHTSGIIEYTHTGKGVGYGCGLHILISKDNGLVFAKVKTDQETNGQAEEECDAYSGDTDKEYCVDISSTTFAVKDSVESCTAANLTTSAFSIDSLDYTTAVYTKVLNALNTTVPDGVGIFYIEDTPDEP